MVWYYGGAFCFANAEMQIGRMCQMASDMNIIVCTPEHGTGPEVQAPEWGYRGYAALKHTIAQADTIGVDLSKLAIHGESSGGHMSTCVAYLLAQKNESHLIKLCGAYVGAHNNDFLTCPDVDPKGDALTTELITATHKGNMSNMALICTNKEEQFANADPNVFPSQMPTDLLSKLPKMLLMTCEYD